MAAAPAAGGGAAAAAVEEKTEFAVVLTAAGANKINVIKVVREVTSLGLKEAKEGLVAEHKEEAEAIKRNLSMPAPQLNPNRRLRLQAPGTHGR